MKRRNFIITLSLILLTPESLLKKFKIRNKLVIKNGWILKKEDF